MKLTIDLSEQEAQNIAGWVNYYAQNPDKLDPPGPTRLVLEERTRARYEQIASQFAPPPVDPLATFRARQAVSQNCAWVLITPAESDALRAVYGDLVSTYNNFYTVGGSGGLGIAERFDAAAGVYLYIDANQKWQQDVMGAADVRVAEIAASQGRTVPGPI